MWLLFILGLIVAGLYFGAGWLIALGLLILVLFATVLYIRNS